MADIEQYQASGWTAAMIASETSKDVALEIISRMELVEEHCDQVDWEDICSNFGGKEKLLAAIYANDNLSA